MRGAISFSFAVATSLIATLAHADGDATRGTLDVSTSDGQGAIRIDGKDVGNGAFHGDLVIGTHDVIVLRPGFKRFSKTVSIENGKTVSIAVSLERLAAAPDATPVAEIFGGLYGGFFVGPSFEPGGSGSTFEQSCSLIGATSCSASPPGGLTIAANVGYTWDPIGIEIFGAFGLDYTSPSATFDGVVQPGSNQALTGPARTEQFRVVRAGGMGAIRARATIDGRTVRVSFAAGAGFGYHVLAMDRHATTTDGSNQTDVFAPQPVTYLSPALSFEASVALRLSRATSLTLGVSAWVENAQTSATTTADPQHYFLPSGEPLRTPSYRLAGGTQFFLWPFVGLQFGP